MCGIVGIQSPESLESVRENLESMTAALHHRGPDFQGLELIRSSSFSLGFGHRRLSILDLSAHANQPMYSKSKNWLLIFNGEIYNHLEIRQSLKRISFTSSSDTETLVEAIDAFGFEATLKKLRGMFALAAYGCNTKRIFLARDRMGEKPLYYGQINSHFLFASELKALTKHKDFSKKIDETAIRQFYFYGYIPAPNSIYQNIYKLPPAHYLIVEKNIASNPICYWQLDEFPSQEKYQFSFLEAKQALKEKLFEIIKMQSIADVPLGSFLSGGIDSSLLSALLKESIGNRAQTYSIGFNEKHTDESKYAEEIAKYLNTKHTTLIASEKDALDTVCKLTNIYDEPFADVSQIPTLLLAKLTRSHVTVAISGDGGDEVFAGYNRYLAIEKWKNYSPFLHMLPPSIIHTLIKKILLWKKYPQVEEKIRKLLELKKAKNYAEAYEVFTRQVYPLEQALRKNLFTKNIQSPTRMFQYFDQNLYLPDDILVKVDRATMAYSLESRAPFLDHSLIEFAWSLPLEFLIKRGQGKYILRSLLEDYIPSRLWDRPKMGFSPPIDRWLRGPLREWVENNLCQTHLFKNPYLSEHDKKSIDAAWKMHKTEKQDCGFQLWPVIISQDWLIKNKII